MSQSSLTKILRLSDALFQGYELLVDLRTVRSATELCYEIKTNLMVHLLFHNLHILAEKLESKKFHIHSIEASNWTEFLAKAANQTDNVIWVCCGC